MSMSLTEPNILCSYFVCWEKSKELYRVKAIIKFMAVLCFLFIIKRKNKKLFEEMSDMFPFLSQPLKGPVSVCVCDGKT